MTKVVTEGRTQEDARRLIEAHAMQLPAADRTKFLEIVETELLKLHAGNIARYRIRPSEFEAWQEKWGR